MKMYWNASTKYQYIFEWYYIINYINFKILHAAPKFPNFGVYKFRLSD